MPSSVRPTTTLTVNGGAHTVAADPETPLLYVLRNDLGLRGAKFGCGTGHCGACTVIIAGRPTRSCDVPLEAVGDGAIETIESLSSGGSLHPIQRALIAEFAGQCGYCLPGIVMSAKALLDADPRPTEGQIRAALDGNLCRCGAHQRFVDAILSVAATAP